MTTEVCAGCGRGVEVGDAFCRGCGKRLNEQPSAQSPLAGERRQLTVMFCDLVGSTQMAARLDPEDVQTILRRYQETATQLIANVEGYIAQYLGDGILAYFGYPLAHEDDPLRAVSAALEIARAVPGLSADLRSEIPELVDDLEVRVGIHTGTVVVGSVGSAHRRETLASGPAVNQAARLAGIAVPGAVVISGASASRVTGVFELEDLGEVALKGISDPGPTHRVLRRRGMQSRLETWAAGSGLPMVGRADILAQLSDAWARVGQGGVAAVLLRGEAGIGKSRLLQAMRERLAPQEHAWVALHGSALQEASALRPVVETLRVDLGLADEGAAVRSTLLTTALERVGLDDPRLVDRIGRLLELTEGSAEPQTVEEREAALDGVVQWWLRVARRQPMVLVLEDLHWFDPSSLDLVARLLREGTVERLLVLGTLRSEHEVPWRGDRVSVLDVPPLRPDETLQVVRQVLADRLLSSETLAALIERSDGVPLYAEELARALVEHEGSPTLATVPASLRDSFTARLDRLGGSKKLAQTGALLGRGFSYALLAAVTGESGPALESGLEELVAGQVLHREGVASRANFTFRHALLQDVAADSMLRQPRRELHQLIARTLVERFPEESVERPGLVAHHLAAAEDTEEALTWYARSGARAASRAELEESMTEYGRAIALLNMLPPGVDRDRRELDVLLDSCVPRSMSASYGDPAVRQAYRRASELCRQFPGGSPRRFESLFGLARSAMVASELDTAVAACEELRAYGELTDDPVHRLAAQLTLGQVRYWQGHFVQSREHCRLAHELTVGLSAAAEEQALRTVGLMHPRVVSSIFASWALWALGETGEAVLEANESIEFARLLGHPYSLAMACSFAGVHAIMLRDPERAQRCAQEAGEIAERHGMALIQGQVTTTLGWVEVVATGEPVGLERVQQGIDVLRGVGSGSGAPGFIAVLAECFGRLGQYEQSLGAAQFGLALSAEKGQRFYDAELLRLVGVAQMQLLGPSSPEAEEALRASLVVARSQRARSFELRTAGTLARLLCDRGDTAAGHRELAAVTEAFPAEATGRELDDARAVLRELS